MDETTLIEAWIYSTLAADDTLTALLGTQPDSIGGAGVFSGQAPKGAVYPVVIMRFLPGGFGDAYYNGANSLWTGCLYQINAVDERSDYEGLDPIATKIRTLLSIKNVVPVAGGNINQCIRIRPDKRPRYEGANQEFREFGAFWDIIAQAI